VNRGAFPTKGEARAGSVRTVMGMRRLLVVLAILALCVPALALADGSPHGRTLVGTLTANPSGSVTVASSTATLTCSVPARAILSVAKLKLGGRFRIACREDGGKLVLVALARVGSGGGGDSSGHGDGSSTGTTQSPTTPPPPPTGGDHNGTTTTGGDHDGGTTTGPTPPPPPPPTASSHTALGVVSFLSSTGVAVTPDGGGTPLTCAITPAPDSTAAAAKLKLGGRFGIVCRLDGTHYVLSGSTPLP
jgi:hypothetical protein